MTGKQANKMYRPKNDMKARKAVGKALAEKKRTVSQPFSSLFRPLSSNTMGIQFLIIGFYPKGRRRRCWFLALLVRLDYMFWKSLELVNAWKTFRLQIDSLPVPILKYYVKRSPLQLYDLIISSEINYRGNQFSGHLFGTRSEWNYRYCNYLLFKYYGMKTMFAHRCQLYSMICHSSLFFVCKILKS